MKETFSTMKIKVILFALLFGFTAVQAQVKFSDNFAFTGTDVTAEETGTGWTGNWSYQGGATEGVDIAHGYIYSTTSGGVSIKRTVATPIANNSTTPVYYSFLAQKSASGSLSVKGWRADGAHSRFGIHINADGSIAAAPGAASPSTDNKSDAGVFENNKTILVVAKYWFAGAKGHMNIALYDKEETIPADDSAITWDLEAVGGNTGVSNDYFVLNFSNPAVLFDNFKAGATWADVTTMPSSDFDFTYPDPVAPSGVKAIATSETSVMLSWADNSFGEDGHKILVNGNVEATVTEGATYEITGLTNITTYTFGVYAYTGDVNSTTAETTYTLDFIDTDVSIQGTMTAPTIDGTVDAVWDKAAKHRIESAGSSDIALENDADYKATWSAMWDDFNVYFLFEVTDQELVFNDGSGSGIGQDDGFDFMLSPKDANGDPIDGAAMVNRINIVDDGTTKSLRLDGHTALENGTAAFTITDTGYIIELSMGWGEFDTNIPLLDKTGYSFGLDVRYNDDDGTNGGKRDGQYCWADKNVDGWVWNSNAVIGKVTLAAAPAALTVSSIVPADDATDVEVDADIVVTFSEAMNTNNVESNITISPAVTSPVYTWDNDEKVLTISADDFTASTEYTVTLSTDVTAASGSQLEAVYTSSFTTKSPVSALTMGENMNVNLYPNPANNYFTISTSKINLENARIEILDISGKHILSEAVNATQNKIKMDVSGFNRGLYIVRLHSNEYNYVGQLIVE